MFLVILVAKLLMHSPLKLQLVKSSSCTSPKIMLLDPEGSLLRFENIADKLLMSSSEADRAKQK